jgi:hypothetical protein
MCKQAAYRMREKQKTAAQLRAEAEALFEKKEAKRQDGLAVIAQFERSQSLAGMLHHQAIAAGARVKFMATQIGVLVVEEEPGALCDVGGVLRLLDLRQVKTRSDDRELKALLSMPSFVGPFIAREAEKECRAVLERGPTDVLLFVDERSLGRAERWNVAVARLERKSPIVTQPPTEELGVVRSLDLEHVDTGDGCGDEFDPRDDPAAADAESEAVMDRCGWGEEPDAW